MNGNDFVRFMLRSPLYVFMGNTMIITVTGRKTGRKISTPVNYLRDGDTLWVVSWRDRKWWRNLRGGANVRVLLSGKGLEGRGQVVEEEKAVAQSLFDYFCKVPHYAKYSKIGLDSEGRPAIADCERAAIRLVMVRIDLEKQ